MHKIEVFGCNSQEKLYLPLYRGCFGTEEYRGYAKGSGHNRRNSARELQNESRQQNKNGEKKINVNFIVKIGVFLYN